MSGSIVSSQTFLDGLNDPCDVYIDNKNTPLTDADDSIWLVDRGNKRIIECSNNGTILRTIDNWAFGTGAFNRPSSICCTEDYIIVVDNGDDNILFFQRGMEQFPGTVGFPQECNLSKINSYSDMVYVTDIGKNCVHKLSTLYYGTYLISFGQFGFGNKSFYFPTGITSYDIFSNDVFMPYLGVSEFWSMKSGLKVYAIGAYFDNLSAEKVDNKIVISFDNYTESLFTANIW